MISGEKPQREQPAPDRWRERFAAALQAQRERAQCLVEDERQRLRGAERMLAEQLDQLRREVEQAVQVEETASAGANQQLLDELETLRRERRELRELLAEAEQRLKAGFGADAEANEEHEHLRRRFEMAVQELRELKIENEDLRERLATRPKSSKQPAGNVQAAESNPAAAGGMDWESQKRQLLARLESDFEETSDDAEDGSDHGRMTVEGAIRITDQVVAEKESEIAELRRQLLAAPGDDHLRQAVDSDELVAQERANLQQLQEQWRDKLREAEIEISIERAKLARERAELEEQLQQIRDELGRAQPQTGSTQPANSPPQRGGRWLTRLGLREE